MKKYEHKNSKLKNRPTHETIQAADPSTAKGKHHRLEIKESDRARIPTLHWIRNIERKTAFAPILTVAEKIDPGLWLDNIKHRSGTSENLFSTFDGLDEPELAHFEWYEHTGHWNNRLIHADAKRAMASLLEHEHMAGSVQCIYFDPPYGMDFDASFLEDALQVTAFRDTYENGIHTYLSGLRDTLTLARELLSDEGSIFMQIGDINVHRAAIVLDEVFGPENRVSTITFKTTGGGSSKKGISKSADYLLWYAKDRDRTYFQELYEEQDIEEWCDAQTFAGGGDFPDGTCRVLQADERRDPKGKLPEGTRLWRMGSLLSQGGSEGERGQPYIYNGVQYGPKGLDRNHWRIDRKGLDVLANKGRLWTNVKANIRNASAHQLHCKIYMNEMPGRRITNLWDRTISASDKRYPVQTGDLAIQRCLLMTTRPGDLVLDPTNGSGTTAQVAETWGRRWIAIDSSRESLAITRERVLMQNYPAHLLVGSEDGFEKEQVLRRKVGQALMKERPAASGNDPSTGLVVERMRYVSAAALAYADRSEKDLFRDVVLFADRPLGKKTGRICGRFTVETEHVADMVSPDEVRRPMQLKRDADWEERIRTAFLVGGFQSESGARFEVDDLQSLVDSAKDPSTVVAAEAGLRWSAVIRDVKSGKQLDAVIAVQAHDSLVSVATIHKMVKAVMTRGRSETLVIVGIEFGPGTEARFAVNVLRLSASTDLHLEGVQNSSRDSASRLFIVAELATEIKKECDGRVRLSLLGLNEFNPVTNVPQFRPKKDIRLWMLDTDYDGLQFHACRIHLPSKARVDKNRKLLREILRSDADNDAINAVFGYESMPFSVPKTSHVAVRAVLAGGGVATTVVRVN